MVIITNGNTISCVRAEKGTDFIKGYDSGGSIVFEASKISDFSKYQVKDGAWDAPTPAPEEQRLNDLEAVIATLLYGGGTV